MSSGRRQSVVIFCASAVSRLYLAPLEHYEPDQVHAFISSRGDALSAVERDVYESSKGEIGCRDITEHRMDTSDYEEILGTIIDIKKDLRNRFGDDLDIFINISSGTPEFSAAGMFASMLPQQCTAFRVDAACNLPDDAMRDILNRVGDSVSVGEPARVTGLRNDDPEDEMISFLSVVDSHLKKTKYPKYRAIIDGLKAQGTWSYDPDRKSGYGRTPLEEREERYLKRHYISAALENGWLERPSANTMRLTDSGRAYISVYGETKANMAAPDELYCMSREASTLPMMPENVVEIKRKGKRYTFTIGMDQHR